MLYTSNLDLKFLWEIDDDKTWLMYKSYMLKFYRLIITKKDKLLMQENMWEQDKSKTHHFVQTHGHIMYQHDTTTSYQGNGTTFSIFASS